MRILISVRIYYKKKNYKIIELQMNNLPLFFIFFVNNYFIT